MSDKAETTKYPQFQLKVSAKQKITWAQTQNKAPAFFRASALCESVREREKETVKQRKINAT